ncbi:MAG TPA: DUF29 domain-containing protein [Lichenihabitans sp.]|jgi:hypothetical protein|nr:DUF29 domain-containing protein [Lichenihabitans sp.]
MADLHQLYKDDFVAWTRDQAEAIRALSPDDLPAAAARGLDLDNLAEEIESLGDSRYDALSSQMRRIIHHLLKLEFSPAEPPRNAWRRSIREARIAAHDILDRNPILRREVATIAADQCRGAVKLALGDLEDHGELDKAVAGKIRARTFDLDVEILSDWMPARRTVG